MALSQRESLLAVTLTASVILNVILWWYQNPQGTGCMVTSGFEAPEVVKIDDSKTYLSQYQDEIRDPDVTLGGVITRSAFDEMLCANTCNGVSYSLAIDSTATNGPAGKGVFVLFQGVHVDYDEATHRITRINGLGDQFYLTRYWCPPSCTPMQ